MEELRVAGDLDDDVVAEIRQRVRAAHDPDPDPDPEDAG
jgi:hypothetical protein